MDLMSLYDVAQGKKATLEPLESIKVKTEDSSFVLTGLNSNSDAAKELQSDPTYQNMVNEAVQISGGFLNRNDIKEANGIPADKDFSVTGFFRVIREKSSDSKEAQIKLNVVIAKIPSNKKLGGLKFASKPVQFIEDRVNQNKVDNKGQMIDGSGHVMQQPERLVGPKLDGKAEGQILTTDNPNSIANKNQQREANRENPSAGTIKALELRVASLTAENNALEAENSLLRNEKERLQGFTSSLEKTFGSGKNDPGDPNELGHGTRSLYSEE